MGSAVRGAWTGPPLLLIAVTLLGFVVAPLVSSPGDATAGEPQGQVQLSAGDRSRADAPGRSPDSLDRAAAKPGKPAGPAKPAKPSKPAEPKTLPRQVIGVASFNAFRKLSYADLLADARTLTTNPAIDIIGWQEAYESGPVFRQLASPGWATKRFGDGELAVSWRRDDFALVSADQRRVAQGVGDEDARYPFPDRHVMRVTLRDRDTKQLISVLDTHLPQAIEDLDRPGRWRPTYNSARARVQLGRLSRMWDLAPGRWVVGTGDYNVDARAESRLRPVGGLSRMFAGRAVSSYAVLGKGISATHPVTGRQIDYVHAARKAVRQGRIEFVNQWTVPGLNSDHRALLVRFALT